MKIRPLLVIALFMAATACPGCATTGGAPAETTELGEQMDRMSGAFRKLRRQAGDAAMNAASLELLEVMRGAAAAARGLIPLKAEELPEADRKKFVEAYRKQVEKLLAALGQLENAFKVGDNAVAMRLVGELGDLQKASHRQFRKP